MAERSPGTVLLVVGGAVVLGLMLYAASNRRQGVKLPSDMSKVALTEAVGHLRGYERSMTAAWNNEECGLCRELEAKVASADLLPEQRIRAHEELLRLKEAIDRGLEGTAMKEEIRSMPILQRFIEGVRH